MFTLQSFDTYDERSGVNKVNNKITTNILFLKILAVTCILKNRKTRYIL